MQNNAIICIIFLTLLLTARKNDILALEKTQSAVITKVDKAASHLDITELSGDLNIITDNLLEINKETVDELAAKGL